MREVTIFVPCRGKWYYLELRQGNEDMGQVDFGELEDAYLGRYSDFKHGSAYVDHVPNPWAVMAYARQHGYTVDCESLERIVGRWEIETTGRYDGLED